MKFDVKTVNKLLGVDDAFKAPTRMMELMLDDKKREETFKKFINCFYIKFHLIYFP